jgi:hypothetical protein
MKKKKLAKKLYPACFPKDIWREIISFFCKPKDFLSIILICKTTSELLYDKCPTYTKNLIFDTNFYLLQTGFRRVYLQNKVFRYIWLLYSFKEYKKYPFFSKEEMLKQFPNLDMNAVIGVCPFDDKYKCGISRLTDYVDDRECCRHCYLRYHEKCVLCDEIYRRFRDCRQSKKFPVWRKVACNNCMTRIGKTGKDNVWLLRQIVQNQIKKEKKIKKKS